MVTKPLFGVGGRVTIGCGDPTDWYRVAEVRAHDGEWMYRLEDEEICHPESKVSEYNDKYDDPAECESFYAAMEEYCANNA